MVYLRYKFNDGGSGSIERGDCVARAIAIALRMPYSEVEAAFPGGIRRGVSSLEAGLFLIRQGWVYQKVPKHVTMRGDHLPVGRLIVEVKHHMVAVINGVIIDTYDPSECGTRKVTGYWYKGPV